LQIGDAAEFNSALPARRTKPRRYLEMKRAASTQLNREGTPMNANEIKDAWFTPARFALLLALAIVCAFPKVALGIHTFFYRDFGVLAYPMIFYHHESFWRGEWPLWNPLSNCGAPFLAQWGTMALYPFSLFYVVLPLPWSLNFFCLAHLFWAGLGMYFLAFRWTEHRLSASVAGVAFVFNGITLSCLNWPNYAVALGWMPWVVLWTERAWREGGRTLIVAASAATMQLLAGVPEIVLLTWLLLLVLWTADSRIVHRRLQWLRRAFRMAPSPSPFPSPSGRGENTSRACSDLARSTSQSVEVNAPSLQGRGQGEGEGVFHIHDSSAADGNGGSAWLHIVRPAVVVLLVCGLSAAQLLPFFDLLAHSQRSAEFATAKWSMPPWGWANLVFPLFRCFLTPQGIFFQMGQEFMTSTYLGVTALLLGLFAVCVVRGRRIWLLAGLALFSLLMALGENGFLYLWVKTAVPLLGFARYPIKFVVLTAFAVPLLAAFAVKWIAGSAKEGESEAPRISRMTPMSAERAPSPDVNPRPSVLSAVPNGSQFMGASRRLLFLLSAGLFITIALLVEFTRQFPTIYDHWPAVLRCGVWRAAFLVASVGLLFALGRVRQSLWRCATGFGLLSLLFVDALTHVPNQNPTLPTYALAPGLFELQHKTPPPRHGEGRVMISPHAEQHLLLSRVADRQSDLLGKRLALWSNLNLLEGAPKVNGSSTLQVREQAEVQSLLYASTNADWPGLADFLAVSLATAPGEVVEWTKRPTALPLVTGGQRPVFADAAQTLRGLTNANFRPNEIVYLPLEARSFVTATNQTDIRITSSKIASQRIELEVEARQSGWVVVAQTHYPAWRATVDGNATRLWRANHAFQALEVPPGTHRITLVYRDRAFQVGASVSLATLVGCVAVWRRKSQPLLGGHARIP